MEKRYKLLNGDCLDKLKELEDNSIDSIVTDPPYGLGFMGKDWDTFDKSQVGIQGEVGENDIEKRNMPAGTWDYSQPCLGGKIISGEKITKELKYQFKHPDPMEF